MRGERALASPMRLVVQLCALHSVRKAGALCVQDFRFVLRGKFGGEVKELLVLRECIPLLGHHLLKLPDEMRVAARLHLEGLEVRKAGETVVRLSETGTKTIDETFFLKRAEWSGVTPPLCGDAAQSQFDPPQVLEGAVI